MLRVFASHSPRAWLRVLRRAASAEVNSAASVSSMFRTEGMGGKYVQRSVAVIPFLPHAVARG